APRNDFVGTPLHRVDLRVLRKIKLGGTASVDAIYEVFNLFNHENYGAYNTVLGIANYGTPNQNTNVVYQPRIMQLRFRLAFWSAQGLRARFKDEAGPLLFNPVFNPARFPHALLTRTLCKRSVFGFALVRREILFRPD